MPMGHDFGVDIRAHIRRANDHDIDLAALLGQLGLT
jgi:hypothetical protein